jgi:endo-alpha-1,4-polygalactosaminidase (GH114 family)
MVINGTDSLDLCRNNHGSSNIQQTANIMAHFMGIYLDAVESFRFYFIAFAHTALKARQGKTRAHAAATAA